MTRMLKDKFMEDLKTEGFLNGIIEQVIKDETLDFQIRHDEIHIYYRGGRLWKLTKKDKKYRSCFDINYCKSNRVSWKIKMGTNSEFQFDLSNKKITLPCVITTKKEVECWLTAIPFLKQCIDEFSTVKKENLERKFQQLVVNENNHFSTSNSTDYFIVDIEYVKNNARFDLVAIKWDSAQASRKLAGNYLPKLAFIEMKFGDKALKGKSGIKKHLEDFEKVYSDNDIKKEMLTVFKQKDKLGLFKNLKNIQKIEKFSDEKPELIFLLADHDPESSILEEQIREIRKESIQTDIKFAVANFMGYGLYTDCIYDLDKFCSVFGSQIKR